MGHMVIVEGLIGAGKSTFTTELGQALGPKTLTMMEPDEQGGANPYLADYYGDMHRWSFTMQIHLLGARYRMQKAAQWHVMTGQDHHACLDRSFYGDTCFARMMAQTGLLSDREFETYRMLYQSMTASVLLPGFCVHLKVDPEVSAERIRERASKRDGRKSELVIDLDYLRNLAGEIQRTVDVLEGQGVTVIEVPWNESRPSEAERKSVINDCVDKVAGHRPLDLFSTHHQRVLV
jgi:deoxyadenosine/deoxycytidine kinase